VEILLLTKKAQVFTIDFVLASFILMIIILTFLYLWNFLGVRWNNINEYNKQYAIGLFATESLVTNAGNPPSWENLETINQNTSFGLVNERNIINQQKLDRLRNVSLQNYSLFKERLGATNYELFINVTNMNRNVSFYVMGNASLQLNETVAFDRFIFFNGSISILRLEIWK